MSELALFRLASDRTRYLSARTAVISSNIANADTPGFKARDLPSFSDMLGKGGGALVSTHSGHLEVGLLQGAAASTVERASGDQKHSRNTVNLEREASQLGEARSQHLLTSSVVAAFHRMLVAAVKG